MKKKDSPYIILYIYETLKPDHKPNLEPEPEPKPYTDSNTDTLPLCFRMK